MKPLFPCLLFACAFVGCPKKEGAEKSKDEPSAATKKKPKEKEGEGTKGGAAPVNDSPNQFLGKGPPTFVIGTGGDALVNRMIAVQSSLISSRIAKSKTIDDASVGKEWPAYPVVYGDPRVNSALASIASELPFQISAGKLVLGGETFTGEDLHLATVVPPGKHHPEMLVYAGTGSPGIAEINSQGKADVPIQIADVFGVLATGTWTTNDDGEIVAKLGPRARRIEWRSVNPGAIRADVRLPKMVKKADDDDDVAKACAQGIDAAAKALGLDPPKSFQDPNTITIYVYPDRRSKEELTGDAGDGVAMVEAHAVHVLKAPLDAMIHLLTHEGTHALAYRTWGPAGSPFFGEGLAVWAADGYAGKTLDQWRSAFAKEHPSVVDLLTKGRALGEPTLYPLAGIFVGKAIATLGRDKVREHFLPATAGTWKKACEDAGTTPEAMEKLLDDAIANGI